jgi:hypothetical protein
MCDVRFEMCEKTPLQYSNTPIYTLQSAMHVLYRESCIMHLILFLHGLKISYGTPHSSLHQCLHRMDY